MSSDTSAVEKLILAAIAVHDAKDGFERAEKWPAFSAAVKDVKKKFFKGARR